jgi:hypothetical protein
LSIIEVSVVTTASVAVIGLGVAYVRTINHRFEKAETGIIKAEKRHIGCSVEVKTKLEAFKEEQDRQGKNISWLVKWAKNGGSGA